MLLVLLLPRVLTLATNMPRPLASRTRRRQAVAPSPSVAPTAACTGAEVVSERAARPCISNYATAEKVTDEVVVEQFTRNVQFLGEEGQARVSDKERESAWAMPFFFRICKLISTDAYACVQVRKSFVIVVGLGGVGSHAAHLLLRSGVGRLRLIDFDQVTLSSLNRHAVATRADVGIPKSTCLARHFARIFPEADIDARNEMYTEVCALLRNPRELFQRE